MTKSYVLPSRSFVASCGISPWYCIRDKNDDALKAHFQNAMILFKVRMRKLERLDVPFDQSEKDILFVMLNALCEARAMMKEEGREL
jgi:hypothetical protein